MSAHLFVLSPQWFEKSSIEEIQTAVSGWEKVMRESEAPGSNRDRFHSDRYSGFMDNVSHATWWLAGYKRAVKDLEPPTSKQRETTDMT